MLANVSLRATAPTLSVIDGIPTCLSTEVAAQFGKRHADVIRAIESLLQELPPEGVRNFAYTPLTNDQNGQTYPAYRLTRDGFTLLAMGFTGSKALAFKLAYIEAFNRMEHMLRGGDAAAEVRELRQTVAQLVDITKTLVANQVGKPVAPKSARGKQGTNPREKLFRLLSQSGGWLTHSYLLRYTRTTSATFSKILQSEVASGAIQTRVDGRNTFYKIGGAA
jgi:Rha family phage regulatory protein